MATALLELTFLVTATLSTSASASSANTRLLCTDRLPTWSIKRSNRMRWKRLGAEKDDEGAGTEEEEDEGAGSSSLAGAVERQRKADDSTGRALFLASHFGEVVIRFAALAPRPPRSSREAHKRDMAEEGHGNQARSRKSQEIE